MAISHGHEGFTGRIGNVVYYYVGQEIWCRTIFPNIRNRVMKDDQYALFRTYSGLFGRSSTIASAIYRALGITEVKLYRTIVGEAMRLFRHTGMKVDEITAMLWNKWVVGAEINSPEVTRNGITKPVIEKKTGRTAREHIARLQRMKGIHGQAASCLLVTKTGVIRHEPFYEMKTVQKRMRITKAKVNIRWKRGNPNLQLKRMCES